MDESSSIEMAVLSVKQSAARCRLLTGGEIVTLRADRHWDMVPGEIITVNPRKRWSYAGHPYLSGEIVENRLDVAALGLVPMRLDDCGEEAETDNDSDMRHQFEMRRIVSGDGEIEDPISQAAELMDAGNNAGARKILMDACQADLRCLDAHAHLGNLEFSNSPKRAIRHYEVGVRLGELFLGDGFDGLLPWSFLDNRPFLRCMHGFGLCLWRLERMDEALGVFERILRLNPMDNQGVRFLVDDIRDRRSWEESRKAELGVAD